MSGLQKFQHVPNEIQAIQFTGDNAEEIMEALGTEGLYWSEEHSPPHIILTNRNGKQTDAVLGDWIVPDEKPNTFYPIDDESFQASYLSIEEGAPSKILHVTWPRHAPEGTPITKRGLKEAWSEFMTPLQEAGRNGEENIKTLLAVFRHLYGAMPEDKK